MSDLLLNFLNDIKGIKDRVFVKEVICGRLLTISKISIDLEDIDFVKSQYLSSGISSSMFDKNNLKNCFEKVIQFNDISFDDLLKLLDLKILHNRAIALSIINAISSFFVYPFINKNFNNFEKKLDKKIIENKLLDLLFPEIKNIDNKKYEKIIKSLENYNTSNISANIKYSDKKIAMVGYFKPLVKYLAPYVKEIGVIDLDRDNLKEAREKGLTIISYDDFNDYDIVIISATSIINNTLGDLLKKIKYPEKVLMGPSVPTFPYFFVKNNLKINYIAGRLILDYEKTKTRIIEEGSTKDLKDSSLKVETKIFI